MKINQMKKDEFFEGFYLIKTAEVGQALGRPTRENQGFYCWNCSSYAGTP